jgi:hypothetical protein
LKYTLLRHQHALIHSIHEYPKITFFFDIAGYGSGKSQADVLLLVHILQWYQGEYLTFGIGGAAIKHLKETVINDFIRLLDQHKIQYRHNSQSGLVQVGTLEFVYFSLDRPESIFGWNLAGAILDELDELEVADRVKQSIIAVQERCRIRLPATSTQPVARSPFIVCTTTAQGMRGTYMFLEYLKEKDLSFIKIRGRTQDNIYLDPEQLENLRSLYTEEEARAYMDGEFINLSTGRVYAEYDDKDDAYMPFEVSVHDTLYVGQDFNPGYNAAVVCIERDGVIYVIDEHHWEVVGDAPRKIRMLYPDNSIVMIPDVSGKEIMRGYWEEFERYGIETIWSNVNPSITERVLVVNKLFRTHKLKVFSTVRNVNMCLKTRGFDDTGKPRKEKGKGALDHWGDSLEYGIWHIVHSIRGFDSVLEIIHGGSTRWRDPMNKRSDDESSLLWR